MAIRTVADIDEAHRSGQVGLVFGLEAATPIENEIDRLDVLYGLGLRQIGIAYSDANALGSGLAEPADGGLTAFGRRAVTRMNKLGPGHRRVPLLRPHGARRVRSRATGRCCSRTPAPGRSGTPPG